MASQPPDSLHGAPSPEQQVEDLRVLLDISRAMAAATQLDELLALILGSLQKVLRSERATLFLYDAAKHELYKHALDGEQIRFSANLGIAGAAATSRQTINIPDAYADPRFNPDIDRRTGFRTRCLVTVPLVGLDEQVVGVVQGVNKIGGIFSKYDQQLTEAFAAQVGVAIQRAHLIEHYVHKKQMESAMAIAREIQQSLLPKSAPVVPGYDLSGWSQPADETGGDCFDFAPLPNQRISLTVADATGHGIGPALVISETRALFRALAEQMTDVSGIMAKANHWLCADLPEGRFVTLFFGVLDPIGHVLHYSSAGHGPLLWYNASRREVTSTGATGPPLGIMDPMEFDAASPVAFAPGDMGIILTDGLIEAPNPAGKLFGEQRLSKLIVEHAQLPANELIQILNSAVRDYMAGGHQLDDFTVIVFKRCS